MAKDIDFTVKSAPALWASSRENEMLQKLIKAWNSKNAKTVTRLGTFGFMAAALSACGGSGSNTNDTTDGGSSTDTLSTFRFLSGDPGSLVTQILNVDLGDIADKLMDTTDLSGVPDAAVDATAGLVVPAGQTYVGDMSLFDKTNAGISVSGDGSLWLLAPAAGFDAATGEQEVRLDINLNGGQLTFDMESDAYTVIVSEQSSVDLNGGTLRISDGTVFVSADAYASWNVGNLIVNSTLVLDLRQSTLSDDELSKVLSEFDASTDAGNTTSSVRVLLRDDEQAQTVFEALEANTSLKSNANVPQIEVENDAGDSVVIDLEALIDAKISFAAKSLERKIEALQQQIEGEGFDAASLKTLADLSDALAALEAATSGEGGLEARLIAAEGKLVDIATTVADEITSALNALRLQIEGEGFDTATLKTLADLSAAIETLRGDDLTEGSVEFIISEALGDEPTFDSATGRFVVQDLGENQTVGNVLAELMNMAFDYTDSAIEALEGLGEGSWAEGDYQTLSALNAAVQALETSLGEGSVSDQLASLETKLEKYADDAVADLETKLSGGLGEGDYATLKDLSDAVAALEDIDTGGSSTPGTVAFRLAGLKSDLESYTDAEIAALKVALEGLGEGSWTEGDYQTLSALNTAVQALETSLGEGSVAVDGQLASLKTTLEGYADDAVTVLETKLSGSLGEGDYATLKDLSDAVAALEDIDTGDSSTPGTVAFRLAGLKSDLKSYTDTEIAALKVALEGLGEGSWTEGDYQTLSALNTAVRGLETALGEGSVSEQLASLRTTLEGYADDAVTVLETKLSGGLGEGDYATLKDLSDAIVALQGASSGDGGLEARLAALEESLGVINAAPQDWNTAFTGENSDNIFTVAEIFGAAGENGSSTVLNSFVSTFASRIEGYDPSTVPLSVTGELTVAQAVALADAGLQVISENVTYTIRDAYTSIQSALTSPDANAAMAGATEVVAFGNSNPNSIDMMAFGPSINLRIDSGSGDDVVSTGAGDHTIYAALGGDTIWLTPTADDSSDDAVVYQTIYDGETLPITALRFSSDADNYQEGSVLTVQVNGTSYQYTTVAGDTVATALQGFATAIEASPDVGGVVVKGNVLEIVGAKSSTKLTVVTDSGAGDTPIVDISNEGQKSLWTVEFSDDASTYPDNQSAGGTFEFARKVYVTIDGNEISADIVYTSPGVADPVGTVAALKTAIEAEMVGGKSLAGVLGAVTIESNGTADVRLVLEGKTAPLEDTDAPTFSVTNAKVDVPGTQQQTTIEFSSNDADYYTGGTLSVAIAGETITADMVPGDASASLQALVSKINTALNGDPLPAVIIRGSSNLTADSTYSSVSTGYATLGVNGVEWRPDLSAGNVGPVTGVSYSGGNSIFANGTRLGDLIDHFNEQFDGEATMSLSDGRFIIETIGAGPDVSIGSGNQARFVFTDNGTATAPIDSGLPVNRIDMSAPTELGTYDTATANSAISAALETVEVVQTVTSLASQGVDYVSWNADGTTRDLDETLFAANLAQYGEFIVPYFWVSGYAIAHPTSSFDLSMFTAETVDQSYTSLDRWMASVSDTLSQMSGRTITVSYDPTDGHITFAGFASASNFYLESFSFVDIERSLGLTAATEATDPLSATGTQTYEGEYQQATISLEDAATYDAPTYNAYSDGTDVSASGRGADVYFEGGKVYATITGAGVDGIIGTADDVVATVSADMVEGPIYYVEEEYRVLAGKNLDSTFESTNIFPALEIKVGHTTANEKSFAINAGETLGEFLERIEREEPEILSVTFTEATNSIYLETTVPGPAAVLASGGGNGRSVSEKSLVDINVGALVDAIQAEIDGSGTPAEVRLGTGLNGAEKVSEAGTGGQIRIAFFHDADGAGIDDPTPFVLRAYKSEVFFGGLYSAPMASQKLNADVSLSDLLTFFNNYDGQGKPPVNLSVDSETGELVLALTDPTDTIATLGLQIYADGFQNVGVYINGDDAEGYYIGNPIVTDGLLAGIVGTVSESNDVITLTAATPGKQTFEVSDVRLDYQGVKQIATISLEDAVQYAALTDGTDLGASGRGADVYFEGGKVYATITGYGADGVLGGDDDVVVTVSADMDDGETYTIRLSAENGTPLTSDMLIDGVDGTYWNAGTPGQLYYGNLILNPSAAIQSNTVLGDPTTTVESFVSDLSSMTYVTSAELTDGAIEITIDRAETNNSTTMQVANFFAPISFGGNVLQVDGYGPTSFQSSQNSSTISFNASFDPLIDSTSLVDAIQAEIDGSPAVPTVARAELPEVFDGSENLLFDGSSYGNFRIDLLIETSPTESTSIALSAKSVGATYFQLWDPLSTSLANVYKQDSKLSSGLSAESFVDAFKGWNKLSDAGLKLSYESGKIVVESIDTGSDITVGVKVALDALDSVVSENETNANDTDGYFTGVGADGTPVAGALDGIIESVSVNETTGEITLTSATTGKETFEVSDVRLDYQGVKQIATVDFTALDDEDATPTSFYTGGEVVVSVQETDDQGNLIGVAIEVKATMADGATDGDSDPDQEGSLDALVAAIQAEIDGTAGEAASVALPEIFGFNERLLDIYGSAEQSFSLKVYIDHGEGPEYVNLTLKHDGTAYGIDAYTGSDLGGNKVFVRQGLDYSDSTYMFDAQDFVQFFLDAPALADIGLKLSVVSTATGRQIVAESFDTETLDGTSSTVSVGIKVLQDDADVVLAANENNAGDFFTGTGSDGPATPGLLTGIVGSVSESNGVITLTSADNVGQQFTVTAATISDPAKPETTTVTFSENDADYFAVGSDTSGTAGQVSVTVQGNTYVVTMQDTMADTMSDLLAAIQNGQGEGTVPALTGATASLKDNVLTFTGDQVDVSLSAISASASVDAIKQVTEIKFDSGFDDDSSDDVDFIAGIGRDLSVTIAGQTFTIDGTSRLELLQDLKGQLETAIAADTGESGIAAKLQATGIVLNEGDASTAPTLTLTARYGGTDPLTVSNLTRAGIDETSGDNVNQEIQIGFTGSYLSGLVTAPQSLTVELGQTSVQYDVKGDDTAESIVTAIATALEAELLVGSATVVDGRFIDIVAATPGPNVLGTVASGAENTVSLFEGLGDTRIEITAGFFADETKQGDIALDSNSPETVGTPATVTAGAEVVPADASKATVDTTQAAKGVTTENVGYTNPDDGDGATYYGDAPITGSVDGEGSFNQLGVKQTYTNPDNGYTATDNSPMSNSEGDSTGDATFFGDAALNGSLEPVSGLLKIHPIKFTKTLELSDPPNTTDPQVGRHQIDIRIDGISYYTNNDYSIEPATLGDLIDDLNETFRNVAEFELVQTGNATFPTELQITMLSTSILDSVSSSPPRFVYKSNPTGATDGGIVNQGAFWPSDDIGEGSFGGGLTGEGVKQSFTNPGDDYTALDASPQLDGEGVGAGDNTLYGSDPGVYDDDGLLTSYLNGETPTGTDVDGEGTNRYTSDGEGDLTAIIDVDATVSTGAASTTSDLGEGDLVNDRTGFAGFEWDEGSTFVLSLGNDAPDVIYNFQTGEGGDVISLEAGLAVSTYYDVISGTLGRIASSTLETRTVAVEPGSDMRPAPEWFISPTITTPYSLTIDLGIASSDTPFSIYQGGSSRIQFFVTDPTTGYAQYTRVWYDFPSVETSFNSVAEFVQYLQDTREIGGSGTTAPDLGWSFAEGVLTLSMPTTSGDGFWVSSESFSDASMSALVNSYEPFNLSEMEFGLITSDENVDQGSFAVTSAELDNVDKTAALLDSLFDFSSTSDNSSLNTTIFGVTASDDDSVTAIWAHQQSSAGDSTVEALELYHLATVNTIGGEFELSNFGDVLAVQVPV